ncbi:hypothetical protein BD410DRAFT_828544 [Rickenella mellea]|uniref:Uncharacterized protein n=1 Tax=Rickenella mellea TaxID=50990 RepID=A0A4Y7Q6G9_9AGAM|nr:hypothetical protein BD410DRAFT_828544 [Rickenella mellea]
MLKTRNGAIQIVGLKNLLKLLTRLESHGLQGTEGEVWNDLLVDATELYPSRVNSSDNEDQSRILRSLDETKTCMAALNEVREILGKKIRSLRKACIPFALENGMKRMPFEVISQIFQAVHLMTDGCGFAIWVSHVSRRFREIALSTSLLWTRIPEHYSDDQVETFLSRSGRLDLDVSMPRSLSDLPPFLQILRPHLNRVTRIRNFDINKDHAMHDLGLTHLPRVKDLHHRCSYHLISCALSSLSGDNGYVVSSPICLSDLTSFEFVADGHRQSLDIASFSEALYCMKSLKRLSLTLDGCHSDNRNVVVTREPRSVSIDTLQVTVMGKTSHAVVKLFYISLSFLVASTVYLTLDVRGVVDIPEMSYIPDAGLSEVMFPYGSVINIATLGIENEIRKAGLLTRLVQDCEIAHTIHFEGRQATFIPSSPGDDLFWTQFSALRHLRFTRCDKLTEWELRTLATNLIIRAQNGDGLQSLEVFDCRGISEECLLELSEEPEVGSKLIWKL